MLITRSSISRGVLVAVGFAIALGFLFTAAVPQAHAALTEAQIQSILSLLSSFGANQATIDNVDSALRGQATSGTPTGSGACSFTRDLTIGVQGSDVTCLQDYLTGTGHFTFSGGSTGYFGSITQSAVAAWQAANGVSPAVGYFGPISQAKYNQIAGSTPGTPAPVPGGTGLSVSSTAQPADSLAPKSAARIPFTNFIVTAGLDGDVVLNSVVVERTGLAADSNFSGIVLLDGDGVQLGISRTLNSIHQATVGEAVTIPRGQSRTFTVAGNRSSSGNNGEVASLSVVGINTSATVSGSLPITGASHTINTTLSLGSVTMNTSSFDPNSAQTKEIGSTGVRFAGVRVTAGSVEAIRVRNLRWNQVGSAGTTDFTNVVVNADGVDYPATVSSDGKYYSVNFGSGIVLGKGNNMDVYIKGDIINGTNRTVIFDIKKTTDIYITGETFGYGLTPTAGSTGAELTTTGAFSTDGDPFFDGSQLTISAGTATTIQRSASVPAQNIAVNVPDQPLGGFETNFKGEAVNISGMTLTIATSAGSTEGASGLTNVSVVDENGSVVAGPVDRTLTGSLVYTDSITFPTGKHVYTVKGKVPSGTSNALTYTITVTPSGWTSPVGDSTGDTVDLSGFGAFALNTMTVKAAALDVTVSPNPVAQNIVTGVQGYTFANYEFDATQSGEDVRFSSMVPLLVNSGSFAGAPSNMTSCQLFDGSTPLNTGSNIYNPSGTATTSNVTTSVTFDNPLVISKGTVKTLAFKCNLSSSADSASTYQWGIADVAANIVVTGVTSSGTVAEGVTASNGQVMTVATGTLVASEDSSSPAYAIVAAGTTGVNHGVINFHASNEDVTLQRIGLVLTNGSTTAPTDSTASSTAQDIVKATLWDGSTKIGEAVFTGANLNATSTLDTPVVIAKDTDKDITVKLDLADIGPSASGRQGALHAVDVDTNGTNTQALGSSGSTVNASGSTTFNGTRVFKSYPTITKLSVPSTALINGVMDLYRFSITANPSTGGGIGLHQLTLNVSTSTMSVVSGTTTVTLVDVYGYTDSNFSSPVPGFTNGAVITQLASLLNSGDNDAQLSSILQIPAGATYYFKVRGTVTLTAGTGTFSGSVTTRLSGDSAYPSLSTLMGAQASVDGTSQDNLVWSPNATTTSAAGHVDWTNGFNVSGLPSTGSDSVTLSK